VTLYRIYLFLAFNLFLFSTLLAKDVSSSDNKDLTDRYLKNAWAGNSYFVMPIMKKSEVPVIDGKISVDEWAKSIKLTGFSIYGKHLLEGERNFVSLATDKENLYIGIRTSAPNNDPGCGLISKAEKRDGAVYSDDSVEIMISPDNNPNIVYHIIINPDGVIFDRKCTYFPQTNDISWNIKDIELKSVAQSGYWELEVKIPFSELGNPKHLLKMNVARNWSQQECSSALIPTRSHLNRKRMFSVGWSNHVPAIKMNGLGSPEEGDWKLKLSIDSSAIDEEFIVAAMLREITFSKINGKIQTKQVVEKVEKKIVKAGTKAELVLKKNVGQHIRYLSIICFNPQNGHVLFSRWLAGRKGLATGRQPVSKRFEIPRAGSGYVFYYPGFNRAAVQMYFSSKLAVEYANVFISGKDGKKITTNMLNKGKYYRALSNVDSKKGRYFIGIEVKFKGLKTKIFDNICEVEKRKFAWENNNYGKDKIIIPPFIPIKTNGTVVKLLNRKHKINALGLWDSLTIKGGEQLAGPMELVCMADGETQDWKAKSIQVKLKDKGYAAQVLALATSRSGVILKSENYFEYDGFYWVKMRLGNVENKVIENLTIRIPLKNQESPMFHAVSNTIRTNPVGNIPNGTGVVWTGEQLKRRTIFGKNIIHPQLVPYIWVGGVEKGFCWFLDSSYGYKLKKNTPSLRIIRHKNELLLEIDIINKPAKIENGHTFEFGMQATPVKPLDKKWRKIVYDSTGEGVKGMDTAQSIYTGLLGYVYKWSKLPFKNDFSLFKNIVGLRDGTAKVAIQENWRRKNWKGIQKILKKVSATDKKRLQQYKRVEENFLKLTFGSKEDKPAMLYKYSDPRLSFVEEEEAKYFNSEWWSPQPQGYFAANRTFPTPSNIDFMVYGYYQQLKHGIQGIYLDDTFVMPTNNVDTLARIDKDGEVHSCLGILAMRELFKRIAVMQYKFECKPRILIAHMTNALLVPCFSFATGQLSWESDFGESPLQKRYSLDAVRAIDTGLHAGLDPVALGGILRKTSDSKTWIKKRAYLTRTALAMTLPHGVKIWNRWSPNDVYWPIVKRVYGILSKFNYSRDDCNFLAYWNKNSAFKVDSDDVIISSYQRPNECLAIISNMTDKALSLKLNIDITKLKLSENPKVLDAETGKSVSIDEVNISAYDFKLIHLSK
jgi:hypothetical protein